MGSPTIPLSVAISSADKSTLSLIEISADAKPQGILYFRSLTETLFPQQGTVTVGSEKSFSNSSDTFSPHQSKSRVSPQHGQVISSKFPPQSIN